MKALLVNETLNFNRDIKSPYAKIGLGISWENLQPGAILKPKKDIYVESPPLCRFVSPNRRYDQKIWEESYLIVIDKSEITEGQFIGYLMIWYYQVWDLSQAETIRENIELYVNRQSRATYKAMRGSLKQFENRLKIVKN